MSDQTHTALIGGDQITSVERIEHTTAIVAAFVGNNSVPVSDLPGLIRSVHATLGGIGAANATTDASTAVLATLAPAVPIKKSVTPDAIICLEDGKSFKSLKRHLATSFDMTPAQYRAKWNLPDDYPMVAPAYAAARSALAKTMGLGQKRAAVAAQPAPTASGTKTAKRGKKAASGAGNGAGAATETATTARTRARVQQAA